MHKVSADEILSAVGSLVGSFCLVWVLFYNVLPFGGSLGFIVCWYFAFLILYAGITSLSHPRPVVVDRVMGAVLVGIGLLVGFVLVTVVVYTIFRGRDVLLHWNFYTKPASAGSLTGPSYSFTSARPPPPRAELWSIASGISPMSAHTVP